MANFKGMYLYKMLLISKMILLVDRLVKYDKKTERLAPFGREDDVRRPVLVAPDGRSDR